jgi:hypothetical protein
VLIWRAPLMAVGEVIRLCAEMRMQLLTTVAVYGPKNWGPLVKNRSKYHNDWFTLVVMMKGNPPVVCKDPLRTKQKTNVLKLAEKTKKKPQEKQGDDKEDDNIKVRLDWLDSNG